ncbi:MAG: hypothetical protein ACRCVN_01460 [Spirochaetia bacterium]
MTRASMRCILYLILFILASCGPPTTRRRPLVGNADHSGGIANVGTDKDLGIPSDFFVDNHMTANEKFLTLSWNAVSDATGYRIYRAVYATSEHMADPQPKEFKLLQEITQPYPLPSRISINHPIPEVPLRRYAYYVTATRYYGESDFSQMIYGWRMPVDEIEALKDMDYSMHFAQSSISNFGEMNIDTTVLARASGSYEYSSKIGKAISNFRYYVDFETTIHGSPRISVTLSPLGIKMNGTIQATGLYTAKITYENLQAVQGGFTQSGIVKIEYDHPSRGKLTKSLDASEARKVMKTVAFNADDVWPKPPRREWDEADPNYVRTIRKSYKNYQR